MIHSYSEFYSFEIVQWGRSVYEKFKVLINKTRVSQNSRELSKVDFMYFNSWARIARKFKIEPTQKKISMCEPLESPPNAVINSS